MIIAKEKLQLWIDKGYNVLFEGKHGAGKSSIMKQAFTDAGLKWIYLGGATMDPFIDFVGVPVKTEKNGRVVVEMVMPEHINPEEVEAIIIDEYNRSAKKVRNGTMELIQFRTVNGKSFPKLKCVWAAINPEEQNNDNLIYDVEPLDPAQKDRFHIHVKLPYKPDKDFFTSKYGDSLAGAAIRWWEELPTEIKDQISPRRLDFTLQLFQDGADIADSLPDNCGVNILKKQLHRGAPADKLNQLMTQDDTLIKTFFAISDNYDWCVSTILKERVFKEKFLHLIPKERLVALMQDKTGIKSFVFKSIKTKQKESPFYESLKEIARAKTNKMSDEIKELIKVHIIEEIPDSIKEIYTQNDVTEYEQKIMDLVSLPYDTTAKRADIYKFLAANLPLRMSSLSCVHALSIVDKILRHSIQSNIQTFFPDIHALINHVLLELLRNGKDVNDIRKLVREHSSVHSYLSHKKAISLDIMASYVEKEKNEQNKISLPNFAMPIFNSNIRKLRPIYDPIVEKLNRIYE